jgi:transposase InsO family protein
MAFASVGEWQSEFTSQAPDMRAEQRDVQLDFSRPGKRIDDAFIESLRRYLRDECTSERRFTSLVDAHGKFDASHLQYLTDHSHSCLGDLTPAEHAVRFCPRMRPSSPYSQLDTGPISGAARVRH